MRVAVAELVFRYPLSFELETENTERRTVSASAGSSVKVLRGAAVAEVGGSAAMLGESGGWVVVAAGALRSSRSCRVLGAKRGDLFL